MPVNTSPILEVEGLSFSYGRSQVLSSVAFCVMPGTYLGIIGPNGGGKTTLLKIMLGLLPPETGRVQWFGADITTFKRWDRIGYVSQNAIRFDPLFPATVEEVALMGRYARRGLFRFITNTDREKAAEALKTVGLWPHRTKRMNDLSGGEKQRVFIARALAGEPEILVLDEPTTGVDHETQEQFYRLLGKLNREYGQTLILVSHDLERVAREASALAVVDRTLRYYTDPNAAVGAETHTAAHHDYEPVCL